MSEISAPQTKTSLMSDQQETKKGCVTETATSPKIEASGSKEVEINKKTPEAIIDPRLIIDPKTINALPKRIQEYSSNHRVKFHLKSKTLELQAEACMRLIESEHTTVKNCVQLLKILRNEHWSYQTPLLPMCALDLPTPSPISTQAEVALKSKEHVLLTDKLEFTKVVSNGSAASVLIDQVPIKKSASRELVAELASEDTCVQSASEISPNVTSLDFKIPTNPVQQVDSLSHLPLTLMAEDVIGKVQRTLDNSHHTITLLQKTRQLLIRQSSKNRRVYSDLKRVRKLPDPVVTEPPAKKSKKRL
ncbi:hypothetical protein DSO57_1011484 [Entomophthora muscae]|uniref:Uncharacterized protein n=1 Tax=Entomophthora muscae TaxID=34485 RepID=A0ACC2RXA6_9FUNG|nr:hypothetical protein DSO57_1011484 [Entomophthora muscae]